MIKSKEEGKISLGISCETSIEFFEGMELINRLVGAVLLSASLGIIDSEEFATLTNAIWTYPNNKKEMAEVFRRITGYSMRFILKD